MSLRVIRCATLVLILHAFSGTAAAQTPATTPVAAAIDFSTIAAGTSLVVEINEPLASSTHKRGDTFSITLIEPLLYEGVEILAAGTRGTGEIVHAAAARGGGAPGELLIAARTLETPYGQLLLRGFKLGATGDDNSSMAIGVSLAAGPFAMFIRGREIVIPAGTRGTARTKVAAASAIPPRTSQVPDTRDYAKPGPETKATAEPIVESAVEAGAIAQPAVSIRPETPVQP